MLKQYRVTVNGQAFDVAVEEIGATAALQATPAAVATMPMAPVTAPNPAAAPIASASPAGPVSAGTVKAPMPGTVIAVKATVGQKVKRGDVLLILEAMKMENEICAPGEGTVTAIRTQAGTAVSTGDPLVDIG